MVPRGHAAGDHRRGGRPAARRRRARRTPRGGVRPARRPAGARRAARSSSWSAPRAASATRSSRRSRRSAPSRPAGLRGAAHLHRRRRGRRRPARAHPLALTCTPRCRFCVAERACSCGPRCSAPCDRSSASTRATSASSSARSRRVRPRNSSRSTRPSRHHHRPASMPSTKTVLPTPPLTPIQPAAARPGTVRGPARRARARRCRRPRAAAPAPARRRWRTAPPGTSYRVRPSSHSSAPARRHRGEHRAEPGHPRPRRHVRGGRRPERAQVATHQRLRVERRLSGRPSQRSTVW